MCERLQKSGDSASRPVDSEPEPVGIAAICEEIQAALLPHSVGLVDVYGREVRLAGFLRVRVEGGMISALRNLQPGERVLWNGRWHRLDYVEVRP